LVNSMGFIGGRSGMTMQRVTLKGQMLGIIIPWMLQIAQRALFWLVMFFTVLMGGDHLPTWIALSIAIYLWDNNRTGRTHSNKMVPIMMLIAVTLCLFASFDYWPTLVEWGRIDTRMSYRVHWGASWDSWVGAKLALDTGWLLASWGVVWLRILSVILLPSIVWLPAKLADWAIGAELGFPQWREKTGPGRVAVESMPMPEGYNLTSDRRSPDPEDDIEPTIIVVPEITKRGV